MNQITDAMDMVEHLLAKFAEGAKGFGILEKEAKLEGRQMIMFLAPDKKK